MQPTGFGDMKSSHDRVRNRVKELFLGAYRAHVKKLRLQHSAQTQTLLKRLRDSRVGPEVFLCGGGRKKPRRTQVRVMTDHVHLKALLAVNFNAGPRTIQARHFSREKNETPGELKKSFSLRRFPRLAPLRRPVLRFETMTALMNVAFHYLA